MFVLTVKTHFDAAHKLDDYAGPCHNLHGHRWDVEIGLVGDKLGFPVPMLADFKDVKAMLAWEMQVFDHKYLNDIIGLGANPTAEFLAQAMFQRLRARVPPGTQLSFVRIWESPECCIEYSE
jgi:6-pyruvoyltetrahydropterin/6-carboxytetrahydropterin synthase